MQIDYLKRQKLDPVAFQYKPEKLFKITAVCEKLISEIKGRQIYLLILKKVEIELISSTGNQLSLIFNQSLKIPFKKNSALLNRLIKIQLSGKFRMLHYTQKIQHFRFYIIALLSNGKRHLVMMSCRYHKKASKR